jgi:hypothetical protein
MIKTLLMISLILCTTISYSQINIKEIKEETDTSKIMVEKNKEVRKSISKEEKIKWIVAGTIVSIFIAGFLAVILIKPTSSNMIPNI